MSESKVFSYQDIDDLVCTRCGLRTDDQHQRPGDRFCHGCPCIDALRARVADLEFRLERVTMRRAASAPPSQESQPAPPAEPDQPAGTPEPPRPGGRGGRRDRKDARTVVLDGERLCLTEAARRLGITGSTLHFRLMSRTKTKDYDGVDVRLCGADRARREGANACS